MGYDNSTKGLETVNVGVNSNDLVKELKKQRRLKKQLELKQNHIESPYYTDSLNYNKNRVKDSNTEKSWKVVPDSREEQMELNKKKINII